MTRQHHKGNGPQSGGGRGPFAGSRVAAAAAGHSTSSVTQPLLEAGSDPSATDLERGQLLEGSTVTVGDVAENVQLALEQHPREAIKWIEDYSCVRLGALRVHASKITDLQEKDALRTFGASSKDIDWKSEWLKRLDGNRPSSDEPDHSALMEVEAFVVDIRNPAGADDSGILNPILHRYQDKICGLGAFSFPAVRAVLNYKWQTWAKQLLTAEVVCYVLWLISFQIFVLLVQDEDSKASLKDVARTTRGIFTLIFEALAIITMLPFVFIEYCTLVEYGCKDWSTAWNTLDILTYAAQIGITVMHVGRLGIHSNGFSVLAAIQVLLLWLKVQYFARCVQPTKNPFMETLRAVINDVKWFLALLLLTLWGFSCSFYILFRKDQEKQEFSTIWMSLSTMFSTMMGGFDLMLYAKSHNPVIAVTLLLVFVFSMSMVLLNCLIAIMCQACEKVNDTEGSVFLLARTQIIDELETTVPTALRGNFWYPNFIHFVQVNRENALLQVVGVEDEESSDESVERLEALEAKLDDAQQQIARLLELQKAVVQQLLPPKQAALLLRPEGKAEDVDRGPV